MNNLDKERNPLYGVTVITGTGYTQYNYGNDNKKTHNTLLYEICKDQIDAIDFDKRKKLENDRMVGLWNNAGVLAKYYDDIVVLENYEYRVAIVFIPEVVTANQYDTVQRIFSIPKFENFAYGDRTLEDGVFKIKSIKNEPLAYILEIIDSKKSAKKR